jgi:hypothetical protein
MKTTKFQAGFSHVAVVLLILFVAVTGVAGYKVATMNNAPESAAVTSSTGSSPDTIKNQTDLQMTGKELDTAGAELDSSLDDGSLDADLNDML